MIKKLIENFKNIKIAVIGDLMLDEYIMGKVERISPEAPVPVVKVTEEKFVLGGAANVINNLAALGANVYCGGLVGNDNNAEKLINAFPKNVDCNLILKADNRPTSYYCKEKSNSRSSTTFKTWLGRGILYQWRRRKYNNRKS